MDYKVNHGYFEMIAEKQLENSMSWKILLGVLCVSLALLISMDTKFLLMSIFLIQVRTPVIYNSYNKFWSENLIKFITMFVV